MKEGRILKDENELLMILRKKTKEKERSITEVKDS